MTVSRAEFLTRLEDYAARTRRAAEAHLTAEGLSPYLAGPAGEYVARGGKGLRPAICLATCSAFGGRVYAGTIQPRTLGLTIRFDW